MRIHNLTVRTQPVVRASEIKPRFWTTLWQSKDATSKLRILAGWRIPKVFLTTVIDTSAIVFLSVFAYLYVHPLSLSLFPLTLTGRPIICEAFIALCCSNSWGNAPPPHSYDSSTEEIPQRIWMKEAYARSRCRYVSSIFPTLLIFPRHCSCLRCTVKLMNVQIDE